MHTDFTGSIIPVEITKGGDRGGATHTHTDTHTHTLRHTSFVAGDSGRHTESNPCLEVHLLFDLNRQLLKWHTMDGPDRQIIYCLKCKKPYGNLSTHMRKVCMKKDTEEMRKERLRQAKTSQKDWTKVARSWEYGEIAELMNSADPCRGLIERLESKGFFVLNNPGRSMADVVTNEKEVLNNVPGSPGKQNHVLDR
ncbi:hypothetical protein AALO_G00089140 [Alosa alosa]|uniref:Uncharacterized protein n=1 Tax=Alosa alosa TaxID=278164 RepID=A0AAV6H3B0_9TELE|nr:hypothetical protein AALO_G00089140 [Alosa alosa]